MNNEQCDEDYDDNNYPGGWFGESWGAPVCDDEAHHRLTPVGVECFECLVAVTAEDRGLIIPGSVPPNARGVILGSLVVHEKITYGLSVVHIECFLKNIRE